jgi:hypothetical protein
VKETPPQSLNHDLRRAIDDDAVSSIQSAYAPPPQYDQPTSSSYLQLYKILKAGDEVLARYSIDSKFYRAIITTVVHKGYTSARYDVKFIDYGTLDTVSWKDIIYDPSKAIRVDSKPAEVSTSVDSFGRDLTQRSSSSIIETNNKHENKVRSMIEELASQVNTHTPMTTSDNEKKRKVSESERLPQIKRDRTYDSLISRLRGARQPPSSSLQELSGEDFINTTTLEQLKGSWKKKVMII